ncbi:flagellar filament capping protein FliD [Chromobacterium amazonense]|uniref:flagellar filament capping protein FliD n=1 Tax=Chromobacterium amazonense TaxID=1382803 RepID=UPI0031F6F5BD
MAFDMLNGVRFDDYRFAMHNAEHVTGMKYESRIARLESESKLAQDYKSAVNTLSSAIRSLEAASGKFLETGGAVKYTGSFSDPKQGSAVIGAGAMPGDYEFEVTQLATSHLIQSGELGDVSINDGPLIIEIDGKEIEINLAELDNQDGVISAETLARAINDHPDNDGKVKANTITLPGGGKSIALQSTKTGESQSMKVTGLDAFEEGNTTHTVEARDAKFFYNGQSYTQSSNTFDGIQGISVTFKQLGEITLNVEQDNDATLDSLAELINSYNDLVSQLAQLTVPGDYANDVPSGPFNSDPMVRGLVRDLEKITNSTKFPPGISVEKDGKLKIDRGVLAAELQKDPYAIEKAIGDSGWLGEINAQLEHWTKDGGALELMDNSATASIDSVKEAMIELQEKISVDYEKNVVKFSQVQVAWMSMQTSGILLDSLFGSESKK